MTQPGNPVEVVRAWQEAANDRDLDRLLALSDPAIRLIGPRGSGHGHQLLRDWLDRAGLRLTTLRTFARGPVVVMAQHGVWRSGETGDVLGEAVINSHFRVGHQRVTQFARHDSLETALAEAGLGYKDEVASA